MIQSPSIEDAQAQHPDMDRGGGMLARLLIAMVAIGLIVAPWIYQPNDMYECWLPWMRATGGLYPWRAYSLANCNYPPFMLYVWIICEAIERIIPLHGREKLLLAVTLVKLPNLLAYATGVLLCSRGLGSSVGKAAADAAAIAYALCLPLWFNAAVWGQCDAMLSLAMLAVVISLLRDRPILAGTCIGWALAIKLQAIVLLPAAAVYTYRRFGFASALKSASAGVIVLGMFIAPMAIAGFGHQVRLSYFGAVGLYPYLSIDTFNPWSLVVLFNLYIRHLPGNLATSDAQLWLGFMTPRQMGLIVFTLFTLWLMCALYRRPSPRNLALTTGLTVYGFYMLSTQMHERYVIPAAAILTIAWGMGAGRIYLAVMLPALLNQLKGMAGPIFNPRSDPTSMQGTLNAVTLIMAGLNLALFLWICSESNLFKPAPETSERESTLQKHGRGEIKRNLGPVFEISGFK